MSFSIMVSSQYMPSSEIFGSYAIFIPSFLRNLHIVLIVARTWKQPRCLLTDEWIKKLWDLYTVEYY